MSRPVPLCALAAVLFTAAVAPQAARAEPFTGWTYTATLTPTGGANAVLLDEGVRVEFNPATGEEKFVPYTAVGRLTTGVTGAFEQGATVGLGGFGYGDWEVYDVLPPDLKASPHTFTATLTFTAPDGSSGSMSFDGSMSASTTAATGTGVFTVNLDETPRFVTVGGYVFGAQFAVRESESASHIEFAACAAPEPGTLALAGAGLAGLVGWRVRRRA